MKKADLISGVFLLVLSGVVINEAWEILPSKSFDLGPGFLPFWLGVLIAVLAVILLARALCRQATEKDNRSPFPKKKALMAVTGVLAGLAVYILLIEVLGYLVDTFLYVVFLLGVLLRERWKMTALVAALTAAGLFIVFELFLGVPLPSNIFGF